MLLTSLSLAVLLSALVDAQYETYSFKSFPQRDIMPLESAYNYAMEQYGEKNWAESIKYLELSLRLHRLLRDSETFCSRNCSSVSRDKDGASADDSLRVMRHILLRAACLKKCKAEFPVFSIVYPKRSLLETFEQRIPYRFLQYAHFQVRGVCVCVWTSWDCCEVQTFVPHGPKNSSDAPKFQLLPREPVRNGGRAPGSTCRPVLFGLGVMVSCLLSSMCHVSKCPPRNKAPYSPV